MTVTQRGRLLAVLLILGALAIGFWRGPYESWQGSTGIRPTNVAVPPSVAGRDFALIAWLPGRALLAGHDPYQAGSGYLERRYHVNLPGSFYPPSILLLMLPLEVLPLHFAIAGMAAVTVLALWLTLFYARRRGGWIDGALLLGLGLVSLYGYEMTLTLTLGQSPGPSLAGMTVIIAAYFAPARWRWRDLALAGGLFLCWTKFQFGIPATVVLLALRAYRPAVWGTVATVVASVPFLVLELIAAGGPRAALHSISHNLSVLDRFNASHGHSLGRSDLAAFATAWRSGPAAEVLVFLGLSILVYLALARGLRRGSVGPLALACLLTGYSILCLDHLAYDEIVLYLPAALAVFRGSSLWVRFTGGLFFVYEYLVWRHQNGPGFPGQHDLPAAVQHLFGGPVSTSLIPLVVFAVGAGYLCLSPPRHQPEPTGPKPDPVEMAGAEIAR